MASGPVMGYPISMNDSPLFEESVFELELSRLKDSYSDLRLVNPRAYGRMLESVKRYGQLSPVVVSLEQEGCFELIDGFKRRHAFSQLELNTIKAIKLLGTERVRKVALVQLNWPTRSIGDLEEALVIQSLYRDDHLSQGQIGVLFGRDKSWVSRRLNLVERLTPEVWEHLRLGLISAGIGRELGRLPRGKQAWALKTVLEHRLNCREVEYLAAALMSGANGEVTARFRPGQGHRETQAQEAGIQVWRLYLKMLGAEKTCQRALIKINQLGPGGLTPTRHSSWFFLLNRLGQTVKELQQALEIKNAAENHV